MPRVATGFEIAQRWRLCDGMLQTIQDSAPTRKAMSKLASDAQKRELGERLLVTRLWVYMSQGDFAKSLNTSLRAYQNYERGEREAPASLLLHLYEKHRVDPVWLLTGSPTSSEVIVPNPEHLRRRLPPITPHNAGRPKIANG